MTLARNLLDELSCVLPERDDREAPRAVRCLEADLTRHVRVPPRTSKRVLERPAKDRVLDAILATEWSDARSIAARARCDKSTVIDIIKNNNADGRIEKRVEEQRHMFKLRSP